MKYAFLEYVIFLLIDKKAVWEECIRGEVYD